MLLAAACLAALGCGGCESGLETGYKPKKLSSSDAERRAYYASPFTPEAKAKTNYDSGPLSPVRTPMAGRGF
jgi:hypothetical protein